MVFCTYFFQLCIIYPTCFPLGVFSISRERIAILQCHLWKCCSQTWARYANPSQLALCAWYYMCGQSTPTICKIVVIHTHNYISISLLALFPDIPMHACTIDPIPHTSDQKTGWSCAWEGLGTRLPIHKSSFIIVTKQKPFPGLYRLYVAIHTLQCILETYSLLTSG